MGWLRELMVEPMSFQDLARQMRDNEHWPARETIQANSLGVKLSKIDRGDEISWLRKRQEVQLVLREVLKCTPDDLEDAMEQAKGPAPSSSAAFRLEDLPGSSPVDLKALKTGIPGFPLIFQNPWTRLSWWVAPGGSGRTLMGQWLEAQQQARHIRGAELDQHLGDGKETWFIDLATLDELLLLEPHHIEERTVCIAAPFAPPRAQTQEEGSSLYRDSEESWFDPTEWWIVRSPAWHEYADAFLDWIETLTQGREDAAFNRDHAAAWFQEEGGSLVDCLGTAIGLCGLINKYGVKRLQKERSSAESLTDYLEKLAGWFFKMKLEESSFRYKNDSAESISEYVIPLLRGITRSMLLNDGAELSGRSLESWYNLVPPDMVIPLSRAQQLERIKAAKSLHQLRQEIEKQPTPHQAVRHLVEAKLLRHDIKPGTHALRPLWAVSALCKGSLRRLLEEPPEVWGKVALHDVAAVDVLEQLHKELAAGSIRHIEQVLQKQDEASLAWVAALECVFRATGVAVLEGREFPKELLLTLWKAQMKLVFWRQDGLPFARLHDVRGERHSPWLTHGTWLIAALAVSEQLVDSVSESSTLAPWTSDSVPATLGVLLNQIEWRSCLPSWQTATLALMGRLYNQVGPINSSPSLLVEWHTIFALLDAVRAGQPLTRVLTAFRDDSTMLPALREEAERREVPWSSVARAFLDYTFQEKDFRSFLNDPEYRAWFWPHLDPVTLAHHLRSSAAWPYDLFSRAHWQVVADLYRAGKRDRNIQINRPFRDLELWRAMPQDLVLTLVREECFHWSEKEVLAVVWGRCLDGMLDVMLDLVAHPEEASYAFSIIANSMTAVQTPAVLARLKVMLKSNSAPLPCEAELQNYLHYVVRKRSPGWTDAFALLHQRQELSRGAVE